MQVISLLGDLLQGLESYDPAFYQAPPPPPPPPMRSHFIPTQLSAPLVSFLDGLWWSRSQLTQMWILIKRKAGLVWKGSSLIRESSDLRTVTVNWDTLAPCLTRE